MTAESLAMPRRPVIDRDRPPVIASTRIAMIALITTELMLFAGFLGMYFVVRLAHETWPPEGQPRLPLFVTALNTVVLFASVVPVTTALRATVRGAGARAARALGLATAMGVVFLAVQGFEWSRLVHHGLTLASSQYGGAFYMLIGLHALHVVAAVVWLTVVTWLARRERWTATAHAGLEMCVIYWWFVAALWAVLFPLVYLY